jgi:hypothetical protein
MSLFELADGTSPPDSQDTIHSSQDLNSSPPRATRSSRKGQRPPTVTPRRFRKFFTPRSHGYLDSPARQALQEIRAPLLNRNVTQSSPLQPFKNINSKEDSPTSFIRGSKRQKTTHTPEASPRVGSRRKACTSREAKAGEQREHLLSSPCDRVIQNTSDTDVVSAKEQECRKPVEPVKRIVSRVDRGLGGQLMDLSISSSVGRRRQHNVYPVDGMLTQHY